MKIMGYIDDDSCHFDNRITPNLKIIIDMFIGMYRLNVNFFLSCYCKQLQTWLLKLNGSVRLKEGHLDDP